MRRLYLFRALCAAVLACLSLTARADDVTYAHAEQYVLKNLPAVYHTLTNRRALVGPHCFMNNTMNGVTVGEGYQHPEYLTDENIENYTTIVKTVSAGEVVMTDIVSVRDMKRYYTSGTEVGFSLVSPSSVKILSLNVAQFFSIFFYKDGRLVASKPVEQGQDVKGLGLSLIQVGTGNDAEKMIARDIATTAPLDAHGNEILFDEIKLSQSGVGLEVGESYSIKYAFVGKAKEIMMTENGVRAYATEQGKSFGTDLKRDTDKDWIYDVCGSGTEKEHFSDDDYTNKSTITVDLVVPISGPIGFRIKTKDGTEVFPAGSTVGFKYNKVGIIEVDLAKLGDVLRIFNQQNAFLDRDYDILENHTGLITVLGLSLISGGDGFATATTTNAFSCADFILPGSVGLGGASVYYAFVRLAPDVEHHCALNITASQELCGCDEQFTLRAAKPVTWYMWEQGHRPSIETEWEASKQNSTTIDSLVHTFGPTDMNKTFVFMARDEDGCEEETTVTYGVQGYIPGATTNNIVYLCNDYDQTAAERKYEDASKTDGGALLHIGGGMHNLGALVTPTLNDFAYRDVTVDLIGEHSLAGVARVDGKSMSKTAADVPFHDKEKRVGFILSQGVSVLDADLLNFLNIRLYKRQANGKYEKITQKVEMDTWDVLSLGIGGNKETARKRVYVKVPAEADFDMVELCSTSVLNANLSRLDVFCAYMENAEVTSTDRKLSRDLLVSNETTNATLDLANSTLVSVATVGNGLLNMTNLIDADYGNNSQGLNAEAQYPAGVEAGGSKVAVNLGRTVEPGQQIVLVMKNLQAGLGVNVANVFQVTTWKHAADGTFTTTEALETKTDWDIVKADVIGTDGYRQVAMTVNKACDQIRIENVQTVSALNALQIYGIVIRSDANSDGTPNELDPNPCGRDLVLQEQKAFARKTKDYDHCTLTFRRTLDANKWNPLTLPVDLTTAQFEEMFGTDAKLSRLSGLVRHGGQNVIQFTLQSKPTSGTFLHKDIPYIVYVTAVSDTATRYLSIDEGRVNGPYYQTFQDLRKNNGVLRNEGVALTPGVRTGVDKYTATSPDYTSVEYQPTWGTVDADGKDKTTAVPTGAYVFKHGEMYHITTKKPTMKTYRGYIMAEETPSASGQAKAAMRFDFGDGAATLIQVVEDGDRDSWDNIYDLSGRKVDLRTAAPGIYVGKGRKKVKR